MLFLVIIGAVLIGHDFLFQAEGLLLPDAAKFVLGVAAGLVIGIFSSMLGVAGGELIIPTLIILFALDIKLAGSLSLAISVPTIIMGLVKYRSRGFLDDIREHASFIAWMSSGSIVGALAGSYLLRYTPSLFLQVLLGLILLASALKLWRS